jgi:proteasome accessory factor A
MTKHSASRASPQRLPKLCGADIELASLILGEGSRASTPTMAALAVLREIDGLPHASGGRSNRLENGRGTRRWSRAADPRDWGRKFLPANGSCCYIDLSHFEICAPETLSAYDHVAATRAMMRIAQEAMRRANERQPPGRTVQLLANNSDGETTWGSHLNVLITREGWENLFLKKLQYLLFLSSFQASSGVLLGQGMIATDATDSSMPFRLSQRAEFLEQVVGPQTTYARPIVNARDEALCGGGDDWIAGLGGQPTRAARLHVISYDSNLAQVASLLKVGMLQIIVAMIEAGPVDLSPALDDPVQALRLWNSDPTLRACARTLDGRKLTAVEHQLLFLERARDFVARGGCDETVPRAGEILALQEDTLEGLRQGDLDRLASRLDWVLKLRILERARERRPDLSWNSPEMRHLDLIYASLDPHDGLFWAYEQSGRMERVVSEERIEQLVREPPEDTRAWTRAALLRRAGADHVDSVNWDRVCLRTDAPGARPRRRAVVLANPLTGRGAAAEAAFGQEGCLDDIVDALEEGEPRPRRLLAAPKGRGINEDS